MQLEVSSASATRAPSKLPWAMLSEAAVNWGTWFLRSLPPEFAHTLALRLLRSGAVRWLKCPRNIVDINFEVHCPSLGKLAHPVGLAAGFDKDALAIPGLSSLGFATIEVGTITPQPQAGNPKPRVFRLADQLSLVNHLGFNNAGCAAVKGNLAKVRSTLSLPLGINVGKKQFNPS